MKAQADAQNALNINKNCAVGYVRLAQVSMYEGKWSDAIVILEMGSRLEPLNEEITNLLQECNDKESQQKKEKEHRKKELGKSQAASKTKESPQKNKDLAVYVTQQKSESQCSTSSKKVPASKKVQLKAKTTSTNQQSIPTCISTLGSKQFWCSLCQVPLDGKPSVQQHLRGKAHSAKIKT
eukprot:PhF_6_TR27035/c0_g1_i1/m.39485